ncbi:hypothetical protein BDK51DRAFT_41737 [Blyttiomyces helicus]|uniref:Uncharacterized protein n=1 Tax=Blyttiomyces helicus TaxID=388810 RepID=A0A4P9WK07_9FUNG|nr:hypothetical protein BDK51DRAFT_41737 [Blyttiomyces helicus]|eukprot:RKO92415.1 hypothetical protein BDK51DRAFT_41737 [Blyttiomyces helicus]
MARCWTHLGWEVRKISSRADYVIGHGGGSTAEYLSTMLVCCEATARHLPLNIWQIVENCGIVHKARLLEGRHNATVYEFITDGRLWDSVRIDNESRVWTAAVASVPGGDDVACLYHRLCSEIEQFLHSNLFFGGPDEGVEELQNPRELQDVGGGGRRYG